MSTISSATVSNLVASSVKNWWWFIIKGLLLLAAGIAILARPLEGYVGLSILFSLIILGVGVSQIIFAAGNSRSLKGWGWTLTAGIIDAIIGILLLSYPLVTLATLPFFLGFWLMFKGFFLMGMSFDLSALGVPNWGWVLFGGILLIVLSGLVLYYPAAGAISIVWYSGAAFLVAGIVNIMLAFRLNAVKKIV